MNSEEQKLKNSEIADINKINSSGQNLKKVEIINQKKIIMPLIYTHNISLSTVSILNYFAIGISLVIYAFIHLEWVKANYFTNIYISYYLISGIVLYFIGIFDWYEGKELIFLIDFVFSFHFISLFLREQKLGDIIFIQDSENPKLQGTLYIIIFILILVVAISAKDKGKIYIVDYAALFLGHFFLCIYKYSDAKWIKILFSIIFIITGILFWATGFLRLMDSGMDTPIILLAPTD